MMYIYEQPFMEDAMKKIQINDDIITDMSRLLMISADETRLKILFVLLQNKKMCVGDIQEEINASQSLVSHQLSVLKRNKLVTSSREGNRIYYSLDDDHIYRLIKVAYDHVMEDKQDESSL